MVCVLCRNSPILPQKCLFSCKRALSSRKRALVQYGANWHQYMPNNAGENDMCILSKEPQVQSKELQVLLYQKRPNKLNGPYECHELNTTHCSMSNSAGENGMCILSKKLYHAGNDTWLGHTARHCNTLQHTATHCQALQHTATHCNTLQHTATHCNTLQHGRIVPIRWGCGMHSKSVHVNEASWPTNVWDMIHSYVSLIHPYVKHDALICVVCKTRTSSKTSLWYVKPGFHARELSQNAIHARELSQNATFEKSDNRMRFYRPIPRTQEIGLKIITTAKISNEFSAVARKMENWYIWTSKYWSLISSVSG